MGNLSLDKRYAWEPADSKVSETMQGYFVNFIKTGNPNGSGLPNWPAYDAKTNYQRMRIDEVSRWSRNLTGPATCCWMRRLDGRAVH